MSYCRFSATSDVYLYADVFGGWTCCWCGLEKEELCELDPIFIELLGQGKYDELNSVPTPVSVRLQSLGQVRDHLQAHIGVGHKVLERAIMEVNREIVEKGEDYYEEPYEC